MLCKTAAKYEKMIVTGAAMELRKAAAEKRENILGVDRQEELCFNRRVNLLKK